MAEAHTLLTADVGESGDYAGSVFLVFKQFLFSETRDSVALEEALAAVRECSAVSAVGG